MVFSSKCRIPPSALLSATLLPCATWLACSSNPTEDGAAPSAGTAGMSAVAGSPGNGGAGAAAASGGRAGVGGATGGVSANGGTAGAAAGAAGSSSGGQPTAGVGGGAGSSVGPAGSSGLGGAPNGGTSGSAGAGTSTGGAAGNEGAGGMAGAGGSVGASGAGAGGSAGAAASAGASGGPSGGAAGITCPAGATFCSGFEESSFPAGTKFHAVGPTGMNAYVIDTAQAFAGRQSLSIPMHSGGFYYRALAVPVPGPDFWVRLHVRVSRAFGDNGHDSLFGASTGNIDADVNNEALVELSEQFDKVLLNTDDQLFNPPGTSTLAADMWHCVETHYDGGTGNVQVFVNGTEIIGATGYARHTFQTFRIGYMQYHDGRAVWYDNVVVAPTRVNCP